jgi:hypothetical protein
LVDFIELFQIFQLARKLLVNVSQDVIILAVEVTDCLTLGGAMHDAVKSAVELVTDIVSEIAHLGQPVEAHHIEDSGDGFGRAIATVTAR